MKKLIGVLILLSAAFAPRPTRQMEVEITSKKFSESVILGEMFRILAEDAGVTSMHLRELGGTRIVFEALRAGEVDLYAEYTGTLINEVFADQQITSVSELRRELEKLGIRMSDPLGFNNTYAHLELVRRSLLPAILCAIPIGVLAARSKWFGHLALGVTGIFQTIPSFALLVMLIPLVSGMGLQSIGAGSGAAVIALFLYSLLPIVRNTQTGLTSIDSGLMESAAVLNLPACCRLFEIELPLASPAILAGIKTAAVMNIGFATLGALVGAGGYGQPILSGIRLADTALILDGAVPAAAMALVTQAAFELIERYAVPDGLRSHS